MKSRALIVTAVSAAGLFVTAAVAQAPADKAGNTKMCGAMGDKRSGMPMKMQQGDVARLADQLAASIAAIQAEKDPAALQQELAAHAALIKELQGQASHMGNMSNH